MPSRLERKVHLSSSRTDALLADQQSSVAVVVTHPWGPLGGNMHNNVVVGTVLYFQRLGFTTVRFNFAGSQIGRGLSQVDQLCDLVDQLLSGTLSRQAHLQNESPEDRADVPHIQPPESIVLIGYSYGSLIAGSATADLPRCIANVWIAPPFAVQHWLLMFHSQMHLQRAAKQQELPRLMVMGDADNFTSESVFQDTVRQYFMEKDQQGDANTTTSDSNTTSAMIKGADHFFARREKDLMDVVGQWLLNTFPQCQGDLRRLRNLKVLPPST